MKVCLKAAAKVWGLYFVLMLVSILFLSSMGAGVLQLVLGLVLCAGFMLLIYGDGAYNGEKGCTLNATMEKLIKEGRSLPDEAAQYAYKPATGVRAAVVCLIPFLLLSVLNLAVAPLYPVDETAPAVEEEAEEEREAFYFDYDADPQAEAAPTNWVNVAARLVYMPYVFVYERVSRGTLNLLFLPFAFIPSAAYLVGYLSGPRLRKKKLHDIALGKKRKQRNLKMHKAPKGPKAEV